METNPPQMTWKSIVRQRMYDIVATYSFQGEDDKGRGPTERGEEIIELAIADLIPFLKEQPPNLI